MVINKTNPSVTEIIISDTYKNVLLLSDVHFDSMSCDRIALKDVLDEALEKDSVVLFNGDFFDMMQGKNDRRHMKGSIRKEYLGDNYFDLIIEDAAEFLKPYARIIGIMADGNHETSVTKHYESNPLDRLCYILKQQYKSPVQHTGYQSWVIIRLQTDKRNKNYMPFKIKMHHGSGGNARVTKGVIEHNRMSTYVEGADLIWLAHTHTQYCMHNTIEVLNVIPKYHVALKKVYHVRTGCWKQEYKAGGWAVEKGFSPSEIGGYWLDLKLYRNIKEGGRSIICKIQQT